MHICNANNMQKYRKYTKYSAGYNILWIKRIIGYLGSILLISFTEI